MNMALAIHNKSAARFVIALEEVLGAAGKYTVLSNVRWQSIREIPEAVTLFDVAVVPADACWTSTDDGRPTLVTGSCPRLAVNFVSAENLQAAMVSTPNTLPGTGLSEYVLFDPTGDVMRPVFQGLVSFDGMLRHSWPTLHSTFFSRLNIRLDVYGPDIRPTQCVDSLVEEELFVWEWERSQLSCSDQITPSGLDSRIERLKSRLRHPRPENGS